MVSSNSIIVTREKAPAKKQAIVREVLADLQLIFEKWHPQEPLLR